ncbi:TetR/AcrR family transcriptional regulator [Streptomyces sp900129855]|uniref:TetR/AcrR family transcriptional regulator n=1 Tax=Streptomyces sp. 900129855 TaxID=3155129 RepID=A0ABV2ZZE2_9ACTN
MASLPKAQSVGVTVPALYYHHENKQAMLVALLERAMDEVLSHGPDWPTPRLRGAS